VDDIEQGKDRAAEYARAYLHQAGHLRNAPVGMEKISLGIASDLGD
jgi:hypothetical protein